MKVLRRKILFILVVIAVELLFTGCPKSNKSIIRAQHLEEGVESPTTIEEIQAAIKKYENRINDIQIASSQVGIWYKLLGTKFLDKKMYGEALKAFEQAVKYYPTNQNIYYYIGVCGGFMANASLDFNGTGNSTTKYNYLKMSEEAFLQAIDLEPRFFRALYSLGVLYVFQLNENEKAIPYLQRACDVEKKNVDPMFVLARAYYATGYFEEAIALYDKIIATTKNEQKQQEAKNNKEIVLNAAYK